MRRGDEAVEQTRDQLEVLRKAGVVDAGAAGLVEIVRGIAAHLAGEPLPEVVEVERLAPDAVHQESSRYRYCTVFVVEGDRLDATALEHELAPLGDSLLVVGDARALKAHVHTDDPGAALRAGTALGVIERRRDREHARPVRPARGSAREPDGPARAGKTAVVAVVAGEGNRRLFESMGATGIVDGGETMNPSTEELLEAIEETRAEEAVVLANNDNVVLAARQAARLAQIPVHVVPSSSIQAGLAAMRWNWRGNASPVSWMDGKCKRMALSSRKDSQIAQICRWNLGAKRGRRVAGKRWALLAQSCFRARLALALIVIKESLHESW